MERGPRHPQSCGTQFDNCPAPTKASYSEHRSEDSGVAPWHLYWYQTKNTRVQAMVKQNNGIKLHR